MHADLFLNIVDETKVKKMLFTAFDFIGLFKVSLRVSAVPKKASAVPKGRRRFQNGVGDSKK